MYDLSVDVSRESVAQSYRKGFTIKSEKTFRKLRNTQLTLRANAQIDNLIDNKTDFTKSVFLFYIPWKQ